MSSPCSEDLVCMNGDFMKSKLSQCALCRFSPENVGRSMGHYWSPTTPARKAHFKHPMLEAEKRELKIQKHRTTLNLKNSRDAMKRTVSRKAAQAERKTEAQIIHATKNSGRRNKDGDHVFQGRVTLDTKLQTTRENPVIHLGELEKVRSDAKRAGKAIGGLVIRNKHNVGCVVLREEDFATLTQPIEVKDEPEVGLEVPRVGQDSINLVERPKH